MAVRKLHVSPKLALPPDVVTSTLIVYGGKGMGKTNFGSVLVEELAAAGLRFSVIDPMGVWWGLRHSADGKGPGIEVLILGGIHGDIPIEPTGGAVVADLVVDEDANLVIDISRRPDGTMWSIAERVRFVRDYCRRLYQRQGERRRPLLQALDEAARFIPQVLRKDDSDVAACMGAIAVLVEEGRNVGVGVALITQRSARLNKDVAELADCMIAFRTVGPNSRRAVLDWLGEHVEKDRIKTFDEQLRALPRGSALVVSPGWLEYEGIVPMRMRTTFDSSATPKSGQERRASGPGAKPDLAKYRERMAATIEKAKAEDPAELRKQVAAVQRELAVERKRTATPAPPRVETKVETRIERVPILTDAHLKVLRAAVHDLRRIWDRTVGLAEQLVEARGELATAARSIDQVIERTKNPPRPVQTSAPPRPSAPQRTTLHQSAPPRRPPEPAAPAADAGVVGGLAKRLIDALAWLEACQICPATRWQAALIAEASAASSYFENTVSGLRTAGLVTYPRAGTLELTPAGRSQARPSSEPIDEAHFQARLFERLGGLRARLLRAAIEAYPQALTREHLGEAAGASCRSSYFENEVSALRSIGLIDYPAPGQVVALPVLFLEGAA